MSERWWSSTSGPFGLTPDERRLLTPGDDPGKDAAGVFLVRHRIGERVMHVLATKPMLTAADIGTAAAIATQPLGDAIVKSDHTYGVSERRIWETLVRKGVSPADAARRTGMVFGVPHNSVSRFVSLATKPGVKDEMLIAEADKALFRHADKISKSVMTFVEQDHPRDTSGRFSTKTATSSTKTDYRAKQKQARTLRQRRAQRAVQASNTSGSTSNLATTSTLSATSTLHPVSRLGYLSTFARAKTQASLVDIPDYQEPSKHEFGTPVAAQLRPVEDKMLLDMEYNHPVSYLLDTDDTDLLYVSYLQASAAIQAGEPITFPTMTHRWLEERALLATAGSEKDKMVRGAELGDDTARSGSLLMGIRNLLDEQHEYDMDDLGDIDDHVAVEWTGKEIYRSNPEMLTTAELRGLLDIAVKEFHLDDDNAENYELVPDPVNHRFKIIAVGGVVPTIARVKGNGTFGMLNEEQYGSGEPLPTVDGKMLQVAPDSTYMISSKTDQIIPIEAVEGITGEDIELAYEQGLLAVHMMTLNAERRHPDDLSKSVAFVETEHRRDQSGRFIDMHDRGGHAAIGTKVVDEAFESIVSPLREAETYRERQKSARAKRAQRQRRQVVTAPIAAKTVTSQLTTTSQMVTRSELANPSTLSMASALETAIPDPTRWDALTPREQQIKIQEITNVLSAALLEPMIFKAPLPFATSDEDIVTHFPVLHDELHGAHNGMVSRMAHNELLDKPVSYSRLSEDPDFQEIMIYGDESDWAGAGVHANYAIRFDMHNSPEMSHHEEFFKLNDLAIKTMSAIQIRKVFERAYKGYEIPPIDVIEDIAGEISSDTTLRAAMAAQVAVGFERSDYVAVSNEEASEVHLLGPEAVKEFVRTPVFLQMTREADEAYAHYDPDEPEPEFVIEAHGINLDEIPHYQHLTATSARIKATVLHVRLATGTDYRE